RGAALQLFRNVLLYDLALVFWFAWEGHIRWQNLLLVSNIFSSGVPIAYNSYWFVEAYVAISLLLFLSCSIPRLRSLLARFPLYLGMIALGLSVLAVFLWRLTWKFTWNTCSQSDCFPVTEIAYWAAIGWCLHFASTTRSRIVTLLCAAG